MDFIEFVAEQNRLNRTHGLRRDEVGGEILPRDYPMSVQEKEYIEASRKFREKQFAEIHKEAAKYAELIESQEAEKQKHK